MSLLLRLRLLSTKRLKKLKIVLVLYRLLTDLFPCLLLVPRPCAFDVIQQELQVRLTSEDDPYFLHSLSLKEEDFQT